MTVSSVCLDRGLVAAAAALYTALSTKDPATLSDFCIAKVGVGAGWLVGCLGSVAGIFVYC